MFFLKPKDIEMADAKAGLITSAEPLPFSAADLNHIWASHLKRGKSGPYFDPIYPTISQYIIENQCRGTLLDLGCGYGMKSGAFQEMGFKVSGIDGDAERITSAQKLFPQIDFIHHRIDGELPFPDNSFDVLFSCSVLQYLDHKSILDECKRVLRPEGALILVENLKNNPITQIGRALLKLRKHRYQSYPWNHFTLNELRAVRKDFTDTLLEVYHLSSPLSHTSYFQNLYPFFNHVDRHLLRFDLFRNLAWRALFCGKNI